MIEVVYKTLTYSGNGFVFSTLLADIIVGIIVILVTSKLIPPVSRSYKRSTKLDKLCGTTPKHWFHGHQQIFGWDEKGLLNSVRRTWKFPEIFNFWHVPFFSEARVFHPDTVISVLGSGAPKNELGYHFMRPWIGDGLLTSKGAKWQRNRKLLTPAFHYSILKPYIGVFNSSVHILMEKWKSRVGNPVDVTDDVSLMTLDSMLQCAMSSNTDCQHIKNSKHPYIEAVHDLSRLVMKRLANPWYFIDWIFNITSDGRKFRKAADVVHSHAERIIRERRDVLKQSSNNQTNETGKFKSRGKKMLDFLDILLQTKDEDGKGLTDREIRDEVDTFLFEGHDTTSSGITWALYNLAKYQKFQEKCRDEAESVLGDKLDLEWEDLSKFSYLTMFIKESMRIHPPVPGISRKLEEPLKLDHSKSPNNTLPESTSITVHIFAQHRNEHIWENPSEFIPERFTKENIEKRSPFAYIPFSAGSRNCIGQNFAMNEIKVVLSQILRRFHLYLDDETPTPIMDACLVLRSKRGVVIKFQPR